MNPVGGLVIVLGIVLIVMGVFGTQRNVSKALKQARPSAGGSSGATAPAPGPGLTTAASRVKRPAVIGLAT